MSGGASYQGRTAALWLARLLTPTTGIEDAVVEVQTEARLFRRRSLLDGCRYRKLR